MFERIKNYVLTGLARVDGGWYDAQVDTVTLAGATLDELEARLGALSAALDGAWAKVAELAVENEQLKKDVGQYDYALDAVTRRYLDAARELESRRQGDGPSADDVAFYDGFRQVLADLEDMEPEREHILSADCWCQPERESFSGERQYRLRG